MGNKSKLSAVVFFLPEIALIIFAFFASAQLGALTLESGQLLLGQCQSCAQSEIFLVSFFLFSFCFVSHCIRFLILHLSGNKLLVNHRPSLAEILISILIFIGYVIFLWSALASRPPVNSTLAIGIFDVLGASLSALSLIIIFVAAISVFSNFSIKER